MAPRILHVLPHPGGGGEVYVDLLARLERYSHERLYLSRHVRPAAAAPSLAAGLLRTARRGRQVDLVHVHGDTSALLVARLLGRRPWLWTTHGLHLVRRSRGTQDAVVSAGMRHAIRRAAATVCSSSAELDDLAALVGGRPGRERLARVIVGIPAPSVAPDARAAVRAELGIADATTVCLFAASLEPRKEPGLAARAVIEARGVGSDVVLVMAGDGPLRGELEALAGEGVRLVGFRDDLDRLMAAADVFVMPSTREGLPLALLEAMSQGVVPVVAEEPGSIEAIGETGISVPAGDVAALADAIADLARNRDERARLGNAARERQRREFALERFLGEMDAIYGRARLL